MTDPEVDDRPRDEGAERAVLGAMMLDATAIDTAIRVLTAEDFYRPIHSILFATIAGLYDAGRPADAVAVAADLHDSGNLLRVGGAPYLHDLLAAVTTTANVGHWADIVADRARRARLVDAAIRVRQLATSHDVDGDPQRVFDRARDIVEAATASRADPTGGGWIGDMLDEHIASWDQPLIPGVPAPYYDLNDLLGGLGAQPGQLIIIAARPGMGKSVNGNDWVVAAAKAERPALLFCLEMTRREVMNRILAAEAGVRLADIRAREIDDYDAHKIETARKVLRELPIRIEDQFGMSLPEIRATARETARDTGLGLIVVDYLQLMVGADPRAPREQQVSGFSRGLKMLAKELEVPIIGISQLNRGPTQRPDHEPHLSDLRESGSLEQDADAVMLLHRPDYYDKESPRSGEVDIHVAKQRDGATGTVTVAHQLHYSRFRDISRR